MEEKILGSAQYFYIHIEKRSLPLEASKALVNSCRGKGSHKIALSMLERTKKHLSLWISDSSQVQIYKRYFGHLAKKDDLTLGECFSPFVLVNAWESFYDILITDRDRRRGAFGWIKEFFENVEIEDVLEYTDPKGILEKLIGFLDLPPSHDFYVATHIAYMINPHTFMPLTKSTGEAIGIREPGAYFRLVENAVKNGIKPIETYAFLHMLYEDVPSKRIGAEQILGIDRELELLKVAERLWNAGDFYEAHEVLEEVWECVKDKNKKECYQGVIRFAIALHHCRSGENKKAENVLKKAIPQMEGCKVSMPLNVRELTLQAKDILHKLKEGKAVDSFPELKVI
ncbi:DUF309 domain-containing protein [Hydrogenivirga sp. 128-5-R1-1]|uniref:DUF309 domain-containing protein n=1 Tax=Hydrogenivirga sp. 128-5-R1-1 TaxID=392423 RepID=UPI00015F2DB6|nr:DUF309 domain-containing protein [Hydrogenivirga sp. 128-5-R1-1]EDP74607.1 hypothetical protein HG1285_08316 [Hydrogenivirga sp. 128-5-R1-1]